MVLYAKAPVRIDFAGGTTDIYPFTRYHEGVVLNAAINKYVQGSLVALSSKTKLEYHADIPTGSGLGTSGVMNVVWLALTNAIKNLNNKIEIAELAYKVEKATDIVGGKQDQYAAVLGGINFLRFKHKKIPHIEPINLRKNVLEELESKLFLYYTGPRLSSRVNKIVMDRINQKNKTVFNTLKEITENARDMRNSLIRGDLEKFANFLNHEWLLRKRLHPGITTKKIENIISFAKNNDALAAKVCGAGGGGCILFYSDHKERVMKKLKHNIINFKFDNKGLRVWEGN